MHFAYPVAVSAALLSGWTATVQSRFVARPGMMASREFLEDLLGSNHEALKTREPAIEQYKQSRSLSPDNTKNKRQTYPGRCGPNFDDQMCETGNCCSSVGWCGVGHDYCSSPACQINYSDSCDAQKKPSGTDTASVARPHVGSVPYGVGVYHCNRPGDIALTWDDGPHTYTEDLLDMLAAYGAQGTFFITGNNLGKGMISDESKPWPEMIRRMIADGHQVASHTWGHMRMSLLTEQQLRDGMVYNEIAFNSILGYFPTYMRPPYSDCNAECQAIMSDLGYHITYFDLDTEGYLHNSEEDIETSRNIWDNIVGPSDHSSDDFLHIEHDPVYWSVYGLTEHMLASIQAKGYRAVTVGDCLNDPPANWYRAVDGTVPDHTPPPTPTSTSSSSSGSTSTPSVSPGRCGPAWSNQLCDSNECCSQYGWCGDTVDHCGTGCQSEFGVCDDVSSTLSTSTSAPSATPSLQISQDGRCGDGVTCEGSAFDSCCSQHGWCGDSDGHCLVANGCQPEFGICSGGSSSSPPISTNDRCGQEEGGEFFGTTCTGSEFDPCCSRYGWCGSSDGHCKVENGCQPEYGTCS